MPPPRAAAATATGTGGAGDRALVIVAGALLLVLCIFFRWWQLCQHPPARGVQWRAPLATASAAQAQALALPLRPLTLLRPLRPPGAPPTPVTVAIRVLTYNTMCLPPPAAPRVMDRARCIGAALKNAVDGGAVDVCCLQEVVFPPAADAMLATAALPFSVAPLTASMFRMNGGVVIGARASAAGVRHHVFSAQKSAAFSWDAMIAKGVVHAWWVLSPRRVLHIYSSHTQSPIGEQYVRDKQIAEWHGFIASYGHDPERDIVVLTGDINLELRDPALFGLMRVRPIEWSALTPPAKRASWNAWDPAGPKELLD